MEEGWLLVFNFHRGGGAWAMAGAVVKASV